jgi:hypothetical protein
MVTLVSINPRAGDERLLTEQMRILQTLTWLHGDLPG